MASSPSKMELEEQDILVLADLIGIDRNEPEYLWIAKEAYNSDLPQGWQIFFDDEGKHFYFDPKTETSTTQHPSIGYYRELYQDFKKQDAEFRKQQEAQELAMGLKEEGKKFQSQKKVISGDDGTTSGTTSEDNRTNQAAELTLKDPDEDADDDLFQKTRLLQAYSHDPNLASHYRKDMKEQDLRASSMLRTILKREEDMFLQRLRLYVAKKEDSARAPLESVLAEYAEASQSHVDDALQAITKQMDDLKTQMVTLAEETKKDTPPKKKDAAAREDRLAKLKRVSGLGVSGLGMESPLGGSLRGMESPTGGSSPLPFGRHLGESEGPISPGKELYESRIKELEEEVKKLEGKVRKDAPEKQEDLGKQQKETIEMQRELEDTRMKLAAANMKNKQHQDELQKLKTMLASSMVQEINADDSRMRMEQMSLEARKLDATGFEETGSRPTTSGTFGPSRPGTSASVTFLPTVEDNRPGTASTTATGFAERFSASGMTADVMLQVLEKVEAMSADGKGPIHQMRMDREKLEATVVQLEEELHRWKEHAEHVEQQNKQHILSIAKVDAQKAEIVRAKEHSEHMEFLAQQYADQVQNLQGMLRKLRDQVSQSQLTVGEDKERARRNALAHGSTATGKEGNEMTKGKNAFSVRVRSATILDVKRCTSTLRSAINLLRIDFQAYAEGIFLPLARELQQGTLTLASSLSAKARDLRICTSTLSIAFASHRLLEDKLHAVYKISFHSITFMREKDDDEQSNFRRPLPRSLTMQLRNGFENKREILETYEFEKVIAEDNDPVTLFQEISPFFARIINWEPATLIITGGRFSRKEYLISGISVVDDNGKEQKLPGVFEQAVEYVSHIYNAERDKLERARALDQYDLQLFIEYSEVLDEETTHYISSSAADKEASGESNTGGKISLADMQKMLSSNKNAKKESSQSGSRPESGEAAGKLSGTGSAVKDDDGKEGNDEEGKEKQDSDDDVAEDEGEHEQADGKIDGDERANFLPSYQVQGGEGKNIAVQCLKLLKDAQYKSQGILNIKQQELERNSSEKVQRAKRLAKKGSRNELGELMQEPHKLITLMLVKRERATDEKQVAMFKIVVLGSPAEKEDPKFEVCRFREEIDQSRHTLKQYLERKYLREIDTHGKLHESALSELIWDTVDSNSSVVLLSCVSPCVDHFDTTIADLRYACKSRRERPTTAARLERVKFRWQNQSAAWAFTLWRGAVADSVQIQLNHEIDNLTEEMTELKTENVDLKAKLQRMAYEGVTYMSDGDGEEEKKEEVGETNVLVLQRNLLEKAIGKELLKLKEKQEGAVLQTVIAKMRYAQSREQDVVQKNKALSHMLHHERHGPRGTASKTRRSQTALGSTDTRGTASASPERERSGVLPPLTRGAQPAWSESSERASKKQALGRTR